MRQHNAAAADVNRVRSGRDLTNHNFGARSGEVSRIMMLGYPVALVPQLFGGHRELDCFVQGIGRRSAFAYRRLVDYAECKFSFQLFTPWATPRSVYVVRAC